MTDRELLELAAKAAGMTYLCWNEGKSNAYYSGSRSFMTSPGAHTPWNPLTDDGDALRLFCTLPWMCIETSDIGVTVRERGDAGGRVYPMFTEWLADHQDDICAATRRAIVRAAAEIGKAA